jgi:hypothetical protein
VRFAKSGKIATAVFFGICLQLRRPKKKRKEDATMTPSALG